MSKNKPYNILIPNSVKSDIKSLDKKVQKQVIDLLKQIANHGYEGQRLSGQYRALYKANFNNAGVQYRLVYYVEKKDIVICLVMVGTRENFYLKLKKRLN